MSEVHTAEDEKAARIRAPNDLGRTANDFGVLKFDCDTTHGANALPASWPGRWVKIRATGGDVHYGFSTASNAEVDRAVASSSAGASSKVGGIVADGLANAEHVQLPYVESGQSLYFVREATVDNTIVYMELASEP